MHRSTFWLTCLLILFVAIGCGSQGPQEGRGLTFEESEGLSADAATSSTDSQAELGDDSSTENVAADQAAADSGSTGSEIDLTSGEGASEETDAVENEGDAPALTLEQEQAVAAITPLMPFVDPWLPVGEHRAKRVQFDPYLDLALVLNMTYIPSNATDYFPDWLMELDGQRVRIRGFMFTTFDGVQGFLLCRDLGPCCFGPNPRADYRIPVTLRDGETTDYIHQLPFDVEGTFHVHLTIDDLGKVSHVYAITDATIIRL